MTKQEVVATITDVVESYTYLPLVFFQLGNSGKGYNMKGVVGGVQLVNFKADLEKALNVELGGTQEFGNMHINQLCNVCVAKAARTKTR